MDQDKIQEGNRSSPIPENETSKHGVMEPGLFFSTLDVSISISYSYFRGGGGFNTRWSLLIIS